MNKLKGPPLGPLSAGWFTGETTTKEMTTTEDVVEESGEDTGEERKEYVYDEEEEGEVQDSEGRWKR